MSTTPRINPIDGYIEHIANAVNEWKADNTPEHLKKTVKKELDSQANTILVKLLGFDASYGKDAWQLDHCNGRDGNSSAGDFIATHQAEAIKEWLSTVAMPTLSAKGLATAQASCQKKYEDQFHYALRNEVQARAQADAKNLVNSLVASKQLDNYLRAMALINPPFPTPENKP
jgi:hypothetical protein